MNCDSAHRERGERGFEAVMSRCLLGPAGETCISANVCNIFHPQKSSARPIANVVLMQDLSSVRRERGLKSGFDTFFIYRLRGLY